MEEHIIVTSDGVIMVTDATIPKDTFFILALLEFYR